MTPRMLAVSLSENGAVTKIYYDDGSYENNKTGTFVLDSGGQLETQYLAKGLETQTATVDFESVVGSVKRMFGFDPQMQNVDVRAMVKNMIELQPTELISKPDKLSEQISQFLNIVTHPKSV